MAPNTTPCARPDADKNDWFIDRHGQQYSDEPWLSDAEKEKLEAAMAEAGLSRLQQISGIARIEAERKRDALGRRRRAREACYQCPLREECLNGALARRETKGTWGGLYEEEVHKALREITRRKRNKTHATQEQPSQAA